MSETDPEDMSERELIEEISEYISSSELDYDRFNVLAVDRHSDFENPAAEVLSNHGAEASKERMAAVFEEKRSRSSMRYSEIEHLLSKLK